MLGLLGRALNAVTGSVAAVWHKVVGLVTAVYSFIDREIGLVERDVAHAYDWAVNGVREAFHDVAVVYDWARSALAADFRDLYHYALTGLNDVRRLLDDWVRNVSSWVDTFRAWVIHTFDDFTHWVVSDIWDPIWRTLNAIVNWVEHEGASIWDLVTHPEKLFAWIASYVWKAWLDILKQWAIPITTYILKQSISLVPDVLDLLEAVIAKVL